MSLGRIAVQILIASSRVVVHAFAQAYQQAAANAAKNGARAGAQQAGKQTAKAGAEAGAAEAQAAAAAATPMTQEIVVGGIKLAEARSVLDVKADATPEQVLEKYNYMFRVNEKKKGGSFYLQSKVVRAKECIDYEMEQRGVTPLQPEEIIEDAVKATADKKEEDKPADKDETPKA